MAATPAENVDSDKTSLRPDNNNHTTTMTTATESPPSDSLQDASEKQHDDATTTTTTTTEQLQQQPVYPGPLKLSLTMLALCISIFLVALDQTIIAPALGAITEQFSSTKDIVRFYLCSSP